MLKKRHARIRSDWESPPAVPPAYPSEEIAKADPTVNLLDVDLPIRLMQYHLSLGEDKKAEEAFWRAVSIVGSAEALDLTLGMMEYHHEAGDVLRADRAYAHARYLAEGKKPAEARVAFTRGRALRQNGYFAKSLSILNEAAVQLDQMLELDQDNATVALFAMVGAEMQYAKDGVRRCGSLVLRSDLGSNVTARLELLA